MSEISFIVLNYNGFAETSKLVQLMTTWDQSKLDFHIVIVDNCSSDDSFERLKSAFHQIEYIDVIQSERNGGYSYGNNYGSKYAIEKYNSEYIAISNPDVEIEQDMIIKLLETFRENDRIAMCAPVMKNVDGSFCVCAYSIPRYEDDLRACSLRNKSRVIHKDYQTLKENTQAIITEMVPGSFFVVRADIFSEVGLFDENIFLYCEERILGKKLKNKDYISVIRSDLFYVHAHAVTTSRAISEIKRWKILLNSRLYYQQTYERVKGGRLLLLKLAMKLYLAQLWVLFTLRNKRKKNNA